MNHIKSILIFLLVLCSPFLFSGCDFGSSDGSDYKIEFTLDGTVHTLTGGYDDPSGVAEGCMRDNGDTFIGARYADDPAITLYLRFKTTTAEEGTYNEGTANRGFNFNKDFVTYYDGSNLDDFTFIITEYGNVGGIIKGTFEGEVQYPETYNITNGYFEVKRKADNSVGSEE